MMDERTEELASAYALGALSAEELRVFEAQLNSDPQLRELVASLREVTTFLGGTSPALQPSGALKARLLMEIGDDRQPPTPLWPKYRGWLPWGLAASFSVICMLFAWQANSLRGQLNAQRHRIDELNMLADALRNESVDLRRTVVTLQQSNRLANIRIALLNSQLSVAPKAMAVSVWDNARQSGVIVGRNLKPPAKDKDYQLWIIDPRYPMPVDAGVFQVDEGGNVRVEFKAKMPIQNANQFAVTEEMKGGVSVPTLKAMVLAGA